MGSTPGAALARLVAWIRADPEGRAAGLVAALATCVVLAWPLALVTHPPLTDLPMHAAHTGALRHFADPSFHFADQFELRPLAVPYLSTYLLGAALMALGLPVSLAVRVATGVALAALPLGVALLCRGLRKSPLWGLAALPLVWGHLTCWGFVNFVAAIGLCAAALGLALRLVDRPSRGGALALAVALAVLATTHVFRFPFAALAVAVGGLSVAIARTAEAGPIRSRARAVAVARRGAPVAIAAAPGLALFTIFLASRPKNLAPGPEALPLTLDPGRLSELPRYLVAGFVDPAEATSARLAAGVVAIVAVAAVASRLAAPRAAPEPPREVAREDSRVRIAGAASLLLLLGAVAAGYLALPLQIGNWWYVYPREATALVVLGLGLAPDLPRRRGARLVATVALAVAGIACARVPARHFEAFERTTQDFRAVSRQIPRAPRLLYLVFDHGGSARTVTPFLHLPAWIQAEKGGWLSFHFAVFGASPLRYRTDRAAVVPPRLPDRWEWEPERFDLRHDAPFFDWFLVRSRSSPDRLFRPDVTIERVAHEGTWWLYRRKR